MRRIAVLTSNKGTGSNLEAIFDAIDKKIIKSGKVVVVVSDKSDALALKRAKSRKIPTLVFPLSDYKNNKVRQDYDNKLGKLLKEKYKIDLVVLAGWMIILSDNFISHFPHQIINLHPGLLPDQGEYITLSNGKKIKAIRGLHTNAAVKYAIDHKYPVTGSTVHLITSKVDEGKVLKRSEVKIKKGDTVESLYKRMKKEEHKILPIAIEEYLKGLKVLIIGSGGREHALVWKLSKSKKVSKIYCAPGNPGTEQYAQNIPLNVSEIKKIASFAKKEKIDITFVGPEVPLIEGIVDLFKKSNLSIIGPTKKASRLEGSKAYAKDIMQKYNVPTAQFKTFTDIKKAIVFIENNQFPIVIKASGQAAGKGVLVAKNKNEAKLFITQVMVDKIFGNSGDKIVIEEYLEGPEVSFMVATDGNDFVSFLPSQDHKRVFDNDKGPNTGGMGAYTPVPFVSKKIIKDIEQKIVKPVIDAMRKEGHPYEGILYPGIILTKDGPKVLEFNCRFGDPETQPLMSLLKTDLIDVFLAIKEKRIKELKLDWYNGFAVCVVITSKGYPGVHEKGKEMYGLNGNYNVNVFHSGTKKNKEKIESSGGRVIGITASGTTLKDTVKNVYRCIGKKKIYFSGMHYRKDIAAKAV